MKTDKLPDLTTIELKHENIPILLGALITYQQFNIKDHEEIKATLKDHEECLKVFKFSKCTLIPWISRNKWILLAIFMFISIWLSTINFASDWASRWLQWVFYPPIKL
jgi:hypothetical protein